MEHQWSVYQPIQDARDRAIHGDWMPPHPFEALQYDHEGSWIGRGSDDYAFPHVLEWRCTTLVCFFGCITSSDLG